MVIIVPWLGWLDFGATTYGGLSCLFVVRHGYCIAWRFIAAVGFMNMFSWTNVDECLNGWTSGFAIRISRHSQDKPHQH